MCVYIKYTRLRMYDWTYYSYMNLCDWNYVCMYYFNYDLFSMLHYPRYYIMPFNKQWTFFLTFTLSKSIESKNAQYPFSAWLWALLARWPGANFLLQALMLNACVYALRQNMIGGLVFFAEYELHFLTQVKPV